MFDCWFRIFSCKYIELLFSACLIRQGKPFNLSSCFVHNHLRNGIIMIRNLDWDIFEYLSSKAIGCQLVFVYVCVCVCVSATSSETANPNKLKFCNADGFRLENFRIRPTVCWKLRENKACTVVTSRTNWPLLHSDSYKPD